MTITRNFGMLMLAIFLIVYGIATAFTIAIPTVLLGILALIAGALILIGRQVTPEDRCSIKTSRRR